MESFIPQLDVSSVNPITAVAAGSPLENPFGSHCRSLKAQFMRGAEQQLLKTPYPIFGENLWEACG
jgi:hypothetical protein